MSRPPAARRAAVPKGAKGRTRKAAPPPPATPGARRSGHAHARRRGPALPRAPRALRVPGAGRLAALLLACLAIAALVALVEGPWLRVETIDWTGASYASDSDVAAILQPVRGRSVLSVDGEALASRLRQLPSVADARVEARFPNAVGVHVTEKDPAFVWQTSAVQLVAAVDGTIIGEIARGSALPAALARLPFIDDQRPSSRNIVEGDRIPGALLAAALQLDAMTPAALGSSAGRLAVQLDDGCGFVLVASRPSWRAVFGSYELIATVAALRARIGQQATAIRTLFASRDEGEVGWIDTRNPGKVYWRPNGPGGSQPC